MASHIKAFVPDSPKQATGLFVAAEEVEKPEGQVEHSCKNPTEHLTDSAPQLVTLHSESARGTLVSECVNVCIAWGVCERAYIYWEIVKILFFCIEQLGYM